MPVPEEQIPVSPPVAPDFYIWSFPGAPVRIHLYLNVVERLAREVRRAYSSIPSHSVEVGGFLLGVSDNYASHIVEVKDFEPFLCEYRPDHRFILSEADLSKMEKALAARRSESGGPLTVLGFYRSHIREGLRLAEDDLSIIKRYFCDPSSIFLLMKPTEETINAGFFFWDNGHIDSEFTFLEFPFDAQHLAAARTKPAADPVDAESEEHAPESDLSHTGEHPLSALPAEPARRQVHWLRWLFYPVFAVLMLALAAGCYVTFIQWFSAPPRTADPDAPPLALQVERQGSDLRVGWKRTAPAIANASGAVLLIRDGESQSQKLTLEPDQLRTGSVVYTPTSTSVQFRLDVTAADGKIVSETVLALAARSPGDVNQPAAPPASLATRPTGANRPSPFNAVPANGTVPAKSELKTFTPPARDRNFGEPVRVVTVDPAAQSANTAPSGFIEPRPSLTTEKAPVTATSPQSNAPAPQNPPANNLAAGNPVAASRAIALPIIPAIPIRQAQPTVPANLRTIITSEIEVEVKVLIDEAGRVLKADPVPSPVSAFLIGAARNAALLWRFEPAKRGGQPVQSEMILKFRFRPAARG